MNLFGSAPTQSIQGGGGGLFGQSQNTQQQNQAPQQGGSNLWFQSSTNQNANSSILGQSQQAQQMPTLAQSQAQLSNSLWQPGKETPHQKPILDQMRMLTEKWDPAHPNCVFKHYFYNRVEESNIPYYRPNANEDAREWEEALQNKPGPNFMPVLGSGFNSVVDRLQTQRKVMTEFNVRLHQINGSLDAVSQRHELETEVRAHAARRRQTTLSERCLALAARVQVLRNRGYALSGDEDDLSNRLHSLEREIQDPAVGAREEELWSRLIVLRGYADQLNKDMEKPKGGDGEGLDEDTEAKAKRVLEDYEKQLQHLKKEVELLLNDYSGWESGANGYGR